MNDLSPFIYGTTRLGDDSIPIENRIEIAKAAIDTKIWFHTSGQYGSALKVLNKAFNSDRNKVPELIVKLEGKTIDDIKIDFQKNTKALDIGTIQIGQLCLDGELARDFSKGGDSILSLSKLKQKGWVKRFVLEIFPWNSDIAYEALSNGHTEGLIDGFIFYFNPLQRFVSNKLWDLIKEKSEPIIALRTIAGGPVHNLRDIDGFAWKEYLKERAREVAPIFEKSGIASWTEFCVRFAHSFSQVRATVGSTIDAEHFNEFLMASEHIEPLHPDIIDAITKLQHKWSDEVDMKSEPWSM
ncbi:MAG: hypothetical protein PF436_05920 [Prolixibacteraceae bacterium]|nr:hypothetical protein [Prolixibacteraceae bacterium]